MGSEARSRRAANKKARGAYQALVTAATSAIKDADPIGLLEIGAPSDEYSPEIDAIVPRSAGAGGPSDAARILHEEFVRWFDEETAGPADAYMASAQRIREAVLEFRNAG